MTTGRPASLLSRLFGLAAVGGNLPKSDGHGIEVRQCVTPNGKLRFFVEHWHNDLSSPSQANTTEIVEQVTGSSPVQETKYADGMFNNKNIYNGVRGWGCRNDDIPAVVRSCHNYTNLHNNRKNDWVYYERSATCGVQITYTLLQGNTIYLEDGCTFSNVPDDYALYPAVIGPATFQDTSAPIPRVDGHGLPHDITVIVAAPGDTSAVVDFEASATDDCDADPTVLSSLPSGHAFPLGSTTVQVTATDDQGNVGAGNLVVTVEAWVDECNDGTHNCHADATCDDLQDEYQCTCKPGFTGNGFTCNDDNECATNDHDCDENASCSNTEGGFLCECNEGWLGNGTSCHTLSPTTSPTTKPSLPRIPSSQPSQSPSSSDWPTSQPSKSPSSSRRPSTSSFPSTQPSESPSASIWPTSQPSTNPSLSSLPSSQPSETPSASHWPTSLPSESPSFSGGPSSMPSKIDECDDGSLNDCDTNAICTETPGGFTCTCNQGWQGNGTTCTNINECANDDNICHEESNCRDTEGGFRCDGLVDDAYVPNSCNKGWTGNGFDCKNIDECATNEDNNCDTNAICTDTPGSFTCTCNQGWRGNGTTCANINECEEDEDDCDKNAICTDTNGSWTCACPDGWIGDGQQCKTVAPTRSPMKSPSTSPTASPSSFPSLQPSIVIQSVTTTGSLSTTVDFCGMEGERLDAYKGAALGSILEVYKCNSECTAEITNLCNTPQSSSRMLQTSTWQLDFAITESFTCEKATCDSLSDTATTASIVAGIATPIEDSLATDEFLTILSQKILDTGIFSADIVLCFAVWGMVNSDPVLEVTTPAEEGLFYPDWLAHSGTCLQGKAPRYMESNPEGWLFDSLEGCCKRYYDGWNFNQCMNIKGSGLWYVSHQNEKCVTDCEEGQGRACGGLANPFSDDLYGDPRSCCVAGLSWRFVEFCEAESLLSNCYAGTGLYYRGDTSGSKVCVRDCDPDASGDTTCGGLVEDTYIELYDSAEECCSEEYGWMENELCAARSDQVSVNKYWPDKTNSKCILDLHEPAEDLSISIYNSTAECCKKGIHWLSEAECLAASGDSDSLVASDMFFVDWVNQRCVQDCEGAPPCTGLGQVQNHDEMYSAAGECCDQIPWIPREKCISGS